MEFSRILPAAAGVIALTATVGFARDLRDNEDYDLVQMRIMERSEDTDRFSGQSVPDHSRTIAINSETGRAYLVEVGYGKNIYEVEIDARSGKVVGRRTVRQIET